MLLRSLLPRFVSRSSFPSRIHAPSSLTFLSTMANYKYPPISPFKTTMLPVDDLHTIAVKELGNAQGVSVLFVHGGPGGGTLKSDAQFFDPTKYHIVLVDQRGSGESTPPSELRNNTTQHLISDLEKVRELLGVSKWHVFGGSWGSTLSLAYAQAHPDRVLSLTLRGIFTLRKEELDFFYQGTGAAYLFPDYFDEFLEVIPEDERDDLVKAYYKRLTSEDSVVRARAGRAWSRWEMATSKLVVDPKYLAQADEPGFADAFARIESHYFVNEGFLPQGKLLEKASIDKIRHIPGVIIQGRYDVVCPLKTSWELHKAWPEADYHIMPTAGHSSGEQSILDALTAAADKFADVKV